MKRQTASRHPTFFGHPRLCPHCHKQVSTQRGLFVAHGPGPNDEFTCPGTGKRVSRPASPKPFPEPAPSGRKPIEGQP